MEYDLLEEQIDLNDPESCLNFKKEEGDLIVSITDWKARDLNFKFSDVYVCNYRAGRTTPLRYNNQ